MLIPAKVSPIKVRESNRANEKTLVCFVSTRNSAENKGQRQETCQLSKRNRFDEKSQPLIALFAANQNAKKTLNCVEWIATPQKNLSAALF